tara:strand:- start:783 stop:1142 length:360 start_codon:yes stop_codon:yes gene_type:complete
MTAKVINAVYREESESFPDWMKYEITLLYNDGETETIPAYGKDLQHALSRVVSHNRAQKVKHWAESVPVNVWILTFLTYTGVVAAMADRYNNPLYMVLGLGLIVLGIFGFRAITKRCGR